MSTKQISKYPIVRANSSNCNEVFDILSSGADWLSQRGMNHWKGAYTKEKIEKRIKEKEVYLIYDKEKAIGTITLDTFPPFYHLDTEKSFWDDSNVHAMYIRGLAVLPSYHGKGLAKNLMDFAEEVAKEKDIHTIRLTAVAHYKELTEFYLKRGYNIVEKRVGKNYYESNFFEKNI